MAFPSSNQRMPGLNWEAPPDVRSLEYVFDQQFAAEQRHRMALVQGHHYTTESSQYGVVDSMNPSTATGGSARPLVVQPSSSNNLYCDVLKGVAVTKAGNIIEVPDNITGIPLAVYRDVLDVLCCVLLEYVTVDDPSTNVTTDYNTIEAVRRTAGPVFDINQIDLVNPSNLDSSHNASTNAIKIVKLETLQDMSKFPQSRLNDCVVLALVKIVTNPAGTPATILSVDMTSTMPLNVSGMTVRPWWSPVDQQHRAALGSGTVTSTNAHGLGYNDLSSGSRTLYQQLLQHGVIISPDIDVPGCPGKLCSEFCDQNRVVVDDGTVTGTASRRYVKLNAYPKRLLGARQNIDAATPDRTVTAVPLAVELIPNTNILLLGQYSGTPETYHPLNGFTVYYTDSDAARPPALPGELTSLANNVVQFTSPATTELVVSGGKAYNTLASTSLSMTNAGPMPKQYRVWLDASQQFVYGPQVVNCAKVIEGSLGVGTAQQLPQFTMWGPARLRVGMWNASGISTTQITVELVGTDLSNTALTETVKIAVNPAVASPRQVAWSQPGVVPDIGPDPEVYQVTQNVFASLTSWRITSKADIGLSGVVQVWADIEPTTTPVLNDALPVARLWWNGQSVKRVDDVRPVVRTLADPTFSTEQTSLLASTLSLLTGGSWTTLMSEDFKNPRWQDVVLSRRDRHADLLWSVNVNETLPSFAADGTAVAREWYYSAPVLFPYSSFGAPLSLWMMLVGDDKSDLLRGSFGGEALVQCQVADVTTPNAMSTWVTIDPVASPPPNDRNARMLDLGGTIGTVAGPFFKIRFRILAKGLRGFMTLIRRA